MTGVFESIDPKGDSKKHTRFSYFYQKFKKFYSNWLPSRKAEVRLQQQKRRREPKSMRAPSNN